MTLGPLLCFHLAPVSRAVDKESISISDYKTVMLRAANINFYKGTLFSHQTEMNLGLWLRISISGQQMLYLLYWLSLVPGMLFFTAALLDSRMWQSKHALLTSADCLVTKYYKRVLVKRKMPFLHLGKSHESILWWQTVEVMGRKASLKETKAKRRLLIKLQSQEHIL